MANSTSAQILLDGPRNVVVKYEGILDTSDLSYVAIIDPATLSAMDNSGKKASTLRIKRIECSIEDLLAVNLFWDATTPRRIKSLTGRLDEKYHRFGGLTNNATGDAGYTGKIGVSTQGWVASAVLSFSLLLELIKCP